MKTGAFRNTRRQFGLWKGINGFVHLVYQIHLGGFSF